MFFGRSHAFAAHYRASVLVVELPRPDFFPIFIHTLRGQLSARVVVAPLALLHAVDEASLGREPAIDVIRLETTVANPLRAVGGEVARISKAHAAVLGQDLRDVRVVHAHSIMSPSGDR